MRGRSRSVPAVADAGNGFDAAQGLERVCVRGKVGWRRALARVDGTAELLSRHATNLTGCFPEITGGLVKALGGRTAILDGETVALDRRARPSFELIQRRMRSTRPQARLVAGVPAIFFVFDMLYLDGEDVMRWPYCARRELLDGLGLAGGPVMTSPFWTGIEAAAMFDVVREMGLEGLVCKRATSVYQPGRRSQAWIKSVSLGVAECSA